MNIERRTLLKGMALGAASGVALNLPGSAFAGALGQRSGAPALVLLERPARDSAFYQGILAATDTAPRVLQASADGEFLAALAAQLRSGGEVLGLLDDASALLAVEQARSAGARVRWLGQHSVDGSRSRHRLLSADASHGCASRLGHALALCGAGFAISESRLDGLHTPSRLQAAPRRAGQQEQWAAALGFALAGAAPGRIAPNIAASGLSGHFVSFSIQA
ncbi:hypothetical protein NK553_24450 [Pseudomonas sp. ZM23]|uniref:PchX n=1 Tax=Pseudomonas triclosanedens TaxID=2961893 RepID=A0ABY6ZS21_9PSED|nr:hypothetical protein [Pseudomonas triclosanedens]MCP8467109.1 hypothetical protein [Pseudomonas triclosanedens]MCP8472742.1 hypothetical protein [Pseudomonas triclosanedens]MCP8478173.1 hypothetical protein [Pseudomonas triclosanedens]WAI47579.1 hypothetical protein OU419_17555 [Pseudomonas triclosanedens]